jgi:hypothetical protein
MVENHHPQFTKPLAKDLIQSRLGWIQHFLGLFGLILIFESWLLWMPQNLYPQVPFFSTLTDLPAILHYFLAGGIVISLFLVLLLPASKKSSRYFLIGFAFISVASILLNQHRFQPWMYHLVITACILAIAPAKLSIRFLRIVVISIYFYSAFSKMDAVFPDLTGGRILKGIFNVIDYDAKFMDPKTFRLLVFMFPAGELLTAILLSFKRSRFFGLILSIIMHLVLFLTFSPLGLHHQNGVLIWNVYFIVQNILLFRSVSKNKVSPVSLEAKQLSQPRTLGTAVAFVLTLTVCLLPLLEPWGYFDHWPAWGLYASRQERVRISIHESFADDIGEELKPYLEPARFNDRWRRLRIHQWSLDKLKAPMYPQDRFQIGVALAVGKKFQLGNKIRIEREGVANRWTGKRTSSEFTGMEEIEQFANRFRLNALPSSFK